MIQVASLRHYETGDRVYVTAQRLWSILTGFVTWSPATRAGRPKTITYGELALRAGYADTRAGHLLGRQLGIIGHFCVANSLPALNTIVVTQHSGKPGDEVVTTDPDPRFIPREQRAVGRFDWYKIAVPTTGMFRKTWESMN